MVKRNGALTPKEQIFVSRMAATGDGQYAATMAGYSHPSQRAYDMMRRPAVAAAVYAEMTKELADLAKPAVAMIKSALDPASVGWRGTDRLNAAKYVVDKLSEMNAAEASAELLAHVDTGLLAEIAEELERRRAAIIEALDVDLVEDDEEAESTPGGSVFD